MKRVIILSLIFLLVLSSLTFAAETKIDYKFYFENLEQTKSLINSNLGNAPGIVKKFLNNENINIHFTYENGDKADLQLILKDGKVESLQKGSSEKADLEVYADEKNINDIINSKNPRKELKDKLQSGAISYKAKGFFNKIKFGFAKIFL